jgi:hypothetical protein
MQEAGIPTGLKALTGGIKATLLHFASLGNTSPHYFYL